jgi:hypothetical protein
MQLNNNNNNNNNNNTGTAKHVMILCGRNDHNSYSGISRARKAAR